jgi:acyl-CoA reductase-like NAD-dependent aldehyde dehydrogenase
MPEITETPQIADQTAAFLESNHQLFIDGQWVDPTSTDTIEVVNPATGRKIATAPAASAADVNAAVVAARAAFEKGEWRTMGPTRRATLMRRLADLIEENKQLFTEIEVLNTGMPITRAGSQAVPRTVDTLQYYAGWATKITGETYAPDPYPAPGVDNFLFTRKEPVGVVGLILPWNFPLAMTMMKLGAALAAGCTIVLKPDEHTPLSTIMLGKLIDEAGFPPGVVNILPGYGEVVGATLTAHDDVDKISFTGSTEVGKKIIDAAKGNLKKVTLELGGKSPFIVFPDADLDRVIAHAVMHGYFLQGQNCICPSRLFIHSKVYDQVIAGIAAGAEALRIGPGLNPDTDLGPLVSATQLSRVEAMVNSGLEEGAELVTGGKVLEREGNFIQPTLFSNANPDMRIVREEIFGPVLSAQAFDGNDLDDIIERANDTVYGLSGSVWTSDISKAMRVAEGVKTGSIGINGHAMAAINSSFGGFKQSGWGREMGQESVEEYLEIKTIMMHY